MLEKLLFQFKKLPENEQLILLALAVNFAPIGQERLRSQLKSTELLSAPALNKINTILGKKLQRLGLIEMNREGWRCESTISEPLMRIAVLETNVFELLSDYALQYQFSHYQPNVALANHTKLLRIYLYKNQINEFIELLRTLGNEYPQHIETVFKRVFFNDLDETWFSSLAVEIRFEVLQYYLYLFQPKLQDCELQYHLFQIYFSDIKHQAIEVTHSLLEHRLYRGDIDESWQYLTDTSIFSSVLLSGCISFLENRNDEAVHFFDETIKHLKKETRKRNIAIPNLRGQFFNFSLLKTRTPENIIALKKHIELNIKHANDHFRYTNHCLLETLNVYQAKAKIEDCHALLYRSSEINSPYEYLFRALMLYWLNETERVIQKDDKFIPQLVKFCKKSYKNGYLWYAIVSASLLAKLECKDRICLKIAAEYQDSPFNTILDLLPRVEAWERALTALSQLNEEATLDMSSELRMIWTVSLAKNEVSLVPREQKIGKNGRWTKGRAISAKRLDEDLNSFDYLTSHDRKICQHIVERDNGYYYYRNSDDYSFGVEALLAAKGHPHLYWADKPAWTAVEVNTAEPQLLVKEQGKNLHISLIPQINSEEDIVLEQTVNDGILLYEVNQQHHQVVDILGIDGLTVPVQAKQQVIDSIAAISSTLTVQSDIGGQSIHAEEVIADDRLHIHLQPVKDGLQIEMFIQPFTDGGPVYKPAAGGSTVLAEIDGKQLQTTRNFKREKKHLKQTLNQCPELYQSKDQNWLMDDPEMALEALIQLQALDDFVILEWPKGKQIRISKEAGFSEVRFSVRKEKDWFSVDGEIVIDEQNVVDMQNLIKLLDASPGRFLKLEDGQFIALTAELRQRLDDFTGLGDLHEGKVRFHPLAAPALEEITEGMALKAEKAWKDQVKRLKEISNFNPKLPSTLQGELRDYQVEGYHWMRRLAHWGAGACLADDMGLGKTIQALALILSRATEGATLILAPTSVCMNWIDEAERFAPTLNVKVFGSGDRQKMLDEAEAFDLVVCSYGLLQSEGEKLAQKHWTTLVADEAQAIKNTATKRSKAAMALNADFKLITTGTPIENHLGELWNLFNFINPGLLGSLKTFNQNYAHAIENNKDHGVQLRLKKLLRPFILRRLKTDVLKELPARTEVTLHIELSKEEQSMYEALRRNAMQKMLESKQDGAPKGQQHLRVLAEIMKLRRACCHPQLVMKESTIASSKLAAFEELVDELIENRHKALVFSQFVGHLSLIRERLDEKGIFYQYLDGSTSIAKRKIAVNSFQAGEGDLFLISLKAGGSGLNLTAADYVIHMDPWWNPAVEDQASDRAHRMGQKRPVTIYRLVAKDTIEDKIVELHQHKRDLANNLLEGGELSGKMSIDEMLTLIKDVN